MVERRGEGGVRLEAWSLAGGEEGGWGSGVRGGCASGSNASEGSSSRSFAHRPPTPLQLCNPGPKRPSTATGPWPWEWETLMQACKRG